MPDVPSSEIAMFVFLVEIIICIYHVALNFLFQSYKITQLFVPTFTAIPEATVSGPTLKPL